MEGRRPTLDAGIAPRRFEHAPTMKRNNGYSGRETPNGQLGEPKRDGDNGITFAARAGTGVVRPMEHRQKQAAPGSRSGHLRHLDSTALARQGGEGPCAALRAQPSA